MGKKDSLARLMYYTGALKLAKLFYTGDLKILAYHRVIDVPSYVDYPFDVELISATTSDFSRQMQHVKNNYTPTTFEQVYKKIQQNEGIEKNSVIVTFDDGFDDNYTNAFPILKNLDMPATFFLSTSYIDTPDVFWFDWVVYLIKKLPNEELILDDGAVRVEVRPGNREEISSRVLSYMKVIPDMKRLELIRDLQLKSHTPAPVERFKDSSTLTWEQVREMVDGGMEIGSHTCTHPILAQLTPEKLEVELTNSKRVIEENLEKECISISYPVGGKDAFDSNVKSICSRNYKVGCSYISGVNDTASSDLFELKRLHVERYISMERFAAMLAAPEIFK